MVLYVLNTKIYYTEFTLLRLFFKRIHNFEAIDEMLYSSFSFAELNDFSHDELD